MSVTTLDWTLFLGPNTPVPHDVIFNIYNSSSEPSLESHIQAHKFVLGAVSGEFRNLLYPSSVVNEDLSQQEGPEKKHFVIIDVASSHEAVQAMLQYIYTGQLVSNLDDTKSSNLLFQTLDVAYQFQLESLVLLLESKILTFPVSTTNVVQVARCAANFSHLSTSSSGLLERCLNLSYNETTLSNLVLLGRECRNASLVAGALKKLKCRVSDANLWTLARMAGCEVSNDDQVVLEASMALQQRCVERLADLMKFPKKFARLTSGLTEEDNSTNRQLMKLLDELFCENCRSVTCQNGMVIDDEVKEATRVRSTEVRKSKVTGEVVGVGVKKVKLESDENEDDIKPDAFCVKIRLDDGTVEVCNNSSGWVYYCK